MLIYLPKESREGKTTLKSSATLNLFFPGEFEEDALDPNEELLSKTIDSGEEDESSTGFEPATFNASTNQSSSLFKSRTGSSVLKRKNRMREDVGEAEDERRSYSSTILQKSSSEETEMRESRSWLGSWYLRRKLWDPLRRDLEIWEKREERESEVFRGMEIMRVSPPA